MALLKISNLKNKYAIVDQKIYNRYKDKTFIWEEYEDKQGYVRMVEWKNGKTIHINLSHLVLGKPKKGYMIDHKLGNNFLNRRRDLRFVTNAQNMRNRNHLNANNISGHRGICWDKNRNKWFTKITVMYRIVFLGRYELITDAIKARKAAEIKYFGKFRGSV